VSDCRSVRVESIIRNYTRTNINSSNNENTSCVLLSETCSCADVSERPSVIRKSCCYYVYSPIYLCLGVHCPRKYAHGWPNQQLKGILIVRSLFACSDLCTGRRDLRRSALQLLLHVGYNYTSLSRIYSSAVLDLLLYLLVIPHVCRCDIILFTI